MTHITEAADVVPRPVDPTPGASQEAENRYYTASQFQLMWWKFKKHRLALIGTIILAIFVFIALFAEFLSPYTPTARTPNYLHGRPQNLHFVDANGEFHLRPFTYALTAAMDPETFLLEVKEDTSDPWPVYFFVKDPSVGIAWSRSVRRVPGVPSQKTGNRQVLLQRCRTRSHAGCSQ
jgi:peptide/nickel transport system permease protein